MIAPPNPPVKLEARIKAAAHGVGFELCGVAAAAEPMRELDYFSTWIEQRHHGEMHYLEARNEAGELKRSRLAHAAPWAHSVIVCAINYNTEAPLSTACKDPSRGWISRYAWNNTDYHAAVLARLRQLEAEVRTISGREDFRSWCYVDTGPVVERIYAKYAGIGWIGKNACILNQQFGSWLFLGVILTSLELAPDLPAPDRCGSCTRCIDACPTDAFIAPHQLDATKCISYLTIEKRGSIGEEFREALGNHVFGCDICQDVCPWNRKAPATTAPEFQPRPELVNPALDWLAAMTPEEWRATFRHSPIRRTKFSGMKRNVAVALGNSNEPHAEATLKTLALDSDPTVAEHARWALAQRARRSTASSKHLT